MVVDLKISNKLKRAMEAARRMAELSNFKYKLGAVIIKHGKIISAGTNTGKTHPLVRKYFRHGTIHAEVAAIIKYRHNKEILKDADIFIFRFTKEGYPALAKPCAQCTLLLHEYGIRRAFWTDSIFPYWQKGNIKQMVKDIDKASCYINNCKKRRTHNNERRET